MLPFLSAKCEQTRTRILLRLQLVRYGSLMNVQLQGPGSVHSIKCAVCIDALSCIAVPSILTHFHDFSRYIWAVAGWLQTAVTIGLPMSQKLSQSLPLCDTVPEYVVFCSITTVSVASRLSNNVQVFRTSAEPSRVAEHSAKAQCTSQLLRWLSPNLSNGSIEPTEP